VLARVDPEALDQVIGRWLTEQQPPSPTTRPPPPTRLAWRQAVAVDGKTLRGSGHRQVHLLAAMDHTSRRVLGQTDVDHTTNEIARFQPLLQPLDLAGRLITADALHTQREHADWLITAKHAAYLLVVKPTSPPCTSSSLPCHGARSPSPTTPATAATAGSRPAACRSPRSPALTSPTPPRRSASPAGSGRSPAGAGAP
jgi:Transposase DDE domain